MKRLKELFIKNTIMALGIIESIFLLLRGAPRDGLELMWLLPLIFSICCGLFWKIYTYHHGGLGLKIAYIIEIIRYLVLPFFISLSNGEISTLRMSYVSDSSYTAAIIIQCIELIVFCSTIYYYYPRSYQRIEKKYSENKIRLYSQNIRILGWGMLVLFLLILAVRIRIWLPALNIYFLKVSSSSTKIVLENTFFSCVKIIILAFTIQKVSKYKPGTKQYIVGIFLVIAWLLFSSLSYFGTNRVYVIENILTSIMLVTVALPKSKRMIMMIVIPCSIALIFAMVVTKQFGLDTADEFSTSVLSVQGVSNTIEEYVNGPWTIAQTYSATHDLTFQTRIHAMFGDLASGLAGLSDLPLIKTIVKSTENWSTASDIMKESFQSVDRGQIISFSGGIFIWFGTWFGWIIFPIVNFILVRILIWTEAKSKIIDSLYFKYMYIWMSILFGLTHCYCIETLLYSWSKFVLVYWLYLKINSFPVVLRYKFKRNYGGYYEI